MVTNYEKFKSRIITLFSRGMTLAVIDGDPCCCRDNSGVIPDAICECCDFRGMGSCEEARVKWLYAEYTEQPKLTKQEMAFLVALDPSFQYVARDKKGHLSFFRIKPEKNLFLEKWDIPNRKCEEQRLFYSAPTCLSFMEEQRLFSFRFDFIIWEDDEPWSVKNLLRLEVIDDDN